MYFYKEYYSTVFKTIHFSVIWNLKFSVYNLYPSKLIRNVFLMFPIPTEYFILLYFFLKNSVPIWSKKTWRWNFVKCSSITSWIFLDFSLQDFFVLPCSTCSTQTSCSQYKGSNLQGYFLLLNFCLNFLCFKSSICEVNMKITSSHACINQYRVSIWHSLS